MPFYDVQQIPEHSKKPWMFDHNLHRVRRIQYRHGYKLFFDHFNIFHYAHQQEYGLPTEATC